MIITTPAQAGSLHSGHVVLLPLTPEYEDARHGVCLKAIEAALNGSETNDIPTDSAGARPPWHH